MTVSPNNNPTIRLFHVHKRYGTKTALLDVTLDIYKNEFLFIHGPSGAGKTTLLKLLYLGERVSEGQILIDGMNLARVTNNKVHLLRRKFGIIFQDFKLIHTKSVFENVALVLEAAGRPNRMVQKKVRSVLRAVGMEKKMDSLPLTLSGGEQQRVAIARAVAGDPKIILADEPTGSLDAESAASVMELLKGFHTRGATVMLATHNKELANRMGSRICYLNQGTLRIKTPQ